MVDGMSNAMSGFSGAVKLDPDDDDDSDGEFDIASVPMGNDARAKMMEKIAQQHNKTKK